MAPRVDRRVFVGSVAAGLPLIAGMGTAAQTHTPAQHGSDLVEMELTRQLQESVEGMRGTKAGEAARRVASTLRVAAAHYAARGVDDQFRSFVNDSIRRDGKDALVLRDLDAGTFDAEMKQFGFATPPPRPPVDRQAREKALDEIRANGITPAMLSIAAEFDRIGQRLDQFPTVAVSRAQCPNTAPYVWFVETVMIISCIVNIIFCAMFSGAYVGLTLGLAIYC